MKKTWFKTLLVVSLLVALASFNTAKAAVGTMSAAPVNLAWDASSDAAVTGYALYSRLTSSSVTNRLDLGTARTATLSSLVASSGYLLFVVAYDAAGLESAPSNLLQYSPPALSGLQVSKQVNGTMSIQFRAAAGALCHVQYSSTLTSPQWQTLNSAIADASGNVVISDPLSGRPPVRFYRAMRF
jgi:hypothetical protein